MKQTCPFCGTVEESAEDPTNPCVVLCEGCGQMFFSCDGRLYATTPKAMEMFLSGDPEQSLSILDDRAKVMQRLAAAVN